MKEKISTSENVVSISKKLNYQDMINKAQAVTDNHKSLLKALKTEQHVIVTGAPGTGKTFTAISAAMELILKEKTFQKLVIVRSIVPVRDIGFLPGGKQEKCSEYELPYTNIFAEIFEKHKNAFNLFKEQGMVEFQPTSFNQGITIDNSFIIVDEAQNLNYEELYNIMTRLGKYSKIAFCGDFKKQDMLKKNKNDKSGYKKFIDVINSDQSLREDFDIIDMRPEDCQRHSIVRKFVLADYSFIED